MAEKSSKLNEDAADKIDQTGALATTGVTDDNVYLENRSADDSSDIAEDTDAPEDETSEETEQLRAQIEETRSNLGETIDAIQEKLSISNIKEQVKDEVSDYIQTAKDSVFDATLGKVGNIMNYVNKGLNEVGDTKIGFAARKNPLAVSLIGLGLGMLLINSYKKKSSTYRYNYDNDYDREDNYDYNRRDDYSRREFASKDRSSASRGSENQESGFVSQTYKGVSDYAGQAYEGVSGAASKVGSTVSGTAGKVSDSVSNAASQAYRQVGNIGSKAKDVAGSAQDQYEQYMEENPLAVGAVALALGAAVGLSIPSTRVENHLMGEARANLVQKASDTAREAIDKVQQVAGEVKQTVQDKVKDQGLTQG